MSSYALQRTTHSSNVKQISVDSDSKATRIVHRTDTGPSTTANVGMRRRGCTSGGTDWTFFFLLRQITKKTQNRYLHDILFLKICQHHSLQTTIFFFVYLRTINILFSNMSTLIANTKILFYLRRSKSCFFLREAPVFCLMIQFHNRFIGQARKLRLGATPEGGSISLQLRLFKQQQKKRGSDQRERKIKKRILFSTWTETSGTDSWRAKLSTTSTGPDSTGFLCNREKKKKNKKKKKKKPNKQAGGIQTSNTNKRTSMRWTTDT